MISPKKLEANRRNAGKSNGPKTPEGKAVSKMNAVKHGLLARQVVVNGHKLKESHREFEALSREFHEYLDPHGPLEKMLVGQMVTIHWRLRRALIAEKGEVALNVDERWYARYCGPSAINQWLSWGLGRDSVHYMQKSAFGNIYILGRFEELKSHVERTGEITREALQKFTNDLGGPPNSLATGIQSFLDEITNHLPESGSQPCEKEKKARILAYLDARIKDLYVRIENCETREEYIEASKQAAETLPSSETLDKILRYQTTLERQLFRIMNHLERLQRRRTGENVPPPVVMDVSNSVRI